MGKDHRVLSAVAENAANAFVEAVDKLVMARLTDLPSLNAAHTPDGTSNSVPNALVKDHSLKL